jgi:hypothetical protein
VIRTVIDCDACGEPEIASPVVLYQRAPVEPALEPPAAGEVSYRRVDLCRDCAEEAHDVYAAGMVDEEYGRHLQRALSQAWSEWSADEVLEWVQLCNAGGVSAAGVKQGPLPGASPEA